MAEKTIYGRSIQKHDTEANWLKATGFTPKQGEIIVYDIDATYNYERIKIGDGTTLVSSLPFVDDALRATLLEQISTVDGRVDAVSNLVGDTSVSTQISDAISQSVAQSDWNENDTTSASYIANRTHWLEDPYLVTLMDGTYNFTSADSNYQYNGDCDFVFVDGQEYTVTFDNIEYVRTAEYMYGATFIGDKSFAGIDSEDDAPFLLIQYDGSIDVVTDLTDATHTVKITTMESVAHQLDEKFIPDSITSDCVVGLSKSGKYLNYEFKGGGSGSISIIGKSGSNTDSEIFNDYTNNTATGKYSHAEGYKNAAGNYAAHAEGGETQATGMYSHTEGYKTTADEDCSHAEGSVTVASGNASHAEGQGSVASGQCAHAEGYNATAMGHSAHAEGRGSNDVPTDITTSTDNDTIITTWETTKFNLAKGPQSHTEGDNTLALDNCAHVEGYQSIASGAYSHAEGYQTRATKIASHAEGYNAIASAAYSHVEGEGTLASSKNQHVQGKYNIEDTSSDYIHIVGNGTSSTRSNAHTLDWDGNAWFAGDVYVGGISQDSGEKLVKASELPSVDTELSTTSTNAVQNKVVTTAINDLSTLVGDSPVADQIFDAMVSKADVTHTHKAEDIIDAEVLIKSSCIPIIDSVNGCTYYLKMENGQLITEGKIVSIELTQLPNKLFYGEGEVLDTRGMIVMATYENGSTGELSHEQWTNIVLTDTVVTLSYKQANNIFTITFNITFDPSLAGLMDFEYTPYGDGTYIVTSWRGTLNGEPSTEMVFPDSNLVKI